MFDFDTVHDRARFASSKWVKYLNRDVLPLWVADMDFATPDFILEAIQARLQHRVIGYTEPPDEFIAAFVDWAKRRFDWDIHPDWIVSFTSVVPGLNAAIRSIGERGDQSVLMTPIYPPFLALAEINGRELRCSPLVIQRDKWCMDQDDLKLHTNASVFLCNPQNPTGRVYSQVELQAFAELCLHQSNTIVSDEIHWGLILDEDKEHKPIASIDREIAQATISLFSHTKTYNIAGLQSAVAVIPNTVLRERFEWAMSGWMSGVSPLAYAAATAAYNDNSTWMTDLRAYLRSNRDAIEQVVSTLHNISMQHVEGTHLAWLDCRSIPVQDHAAYFEAHGLGFSDGVEFGTPGFVRFNFATPRSLLNQALDRLKVGSACAP